MAPHVKATLSRICSWNGYRITTDVHAPADAVMVWDIATVRTPRAYANLPNHLRAINARCIDVSKRHVDQVFADVFGYDIRIDPLIHAGPCVRKSNDNGRHDGVILSCPIPHVDDGYVYQRVINNHLNDELVEDLRVPIFPRRIPFVYRAHREASARFAVPNWIVKCHPTAHVFTEDEVRRIRLFCQALGLDFGELDVLRDRDEGRMYIVDANPTPWGPPADLAWFHQSFAINALGEAFKEDILRAARETRIS
jgi:hypothetical protein